MALQRGVQLDPDSTQPLAPGYYELEYPVIAGNPDQVNRPQLEKTLTSKFGGQVALIDWKSSADKKSLIVRVQVLPSTAASADGMMAVMAVPVVVTMVAIVLFFTTLVVGWSLYLDKRPSAFALVPENQRGDVAKTQAAATAVSLGAVAFILGLIFIPRKKGASA